MDVITPIEARAQSAILMQPCDGPFHHPAKLSETAAVFLAALGDERNDPALPQSIAVRLRMIGAIAEQRKGSGPGMTHLARDGRDRIDQRDELGHIVAVRSRENGTQWSPAPLGDHMMLAAQFPAICRAGARFFPPPTARTVPESTTARDQSILSASLSLSSRI